MEPGVEPGDDAPTPPAPAPPQDRIAFGMDAGSIQAQRAAGFEPDLATLWLGPWNLKHGWEVPDEKLRTMAREGITPAVHLYYWGDDLSPRCLEQGCWSSLHQVHKDKEGWQELVEQAVEHLNKTLEGKEVIVLLESEFNKAGVATYEPLDGYLTEKIAFIQEAYPPARVVVSLGNWNHDAWSTWDRAGRQADAVGIQAIRASTRDTLASQLGLFNATLIGAEALYNQFDKPIVLQDISISSYPEPGNLITQARALGRMFQGLGELEALGVDTFIYRSWYDDPAMSSENYFGQAEKFWGLVSYPSREPKPAAQVWLDGVRGELN